MDPDPQVRSGGLPLRVSPCPPRLRGSLSSIPGEEEGTTAEARRTRRGAEEEEQRDGALARYAGRVFRRFPPPDPAALATLCGAAALGGLGLLPGAAGALDARTLLGWLALCAPAAGALCGARGLGWFPFALAVPGAWVVVLVLLDASAGGALPTPLWAACALVGLFAAGLAVGKRAGAPLR